MTASDMRPLSLQIQDALDWYREARRRRDAFRTEITAELDKLDYYTNDLGGAEDNLKALLVDNQLDYAENDSFTVSVIRSERGGYDASRLPKTAEVLDACTLTIDKRAVENLVKRGLLSQHDADAAYESKQAAPYLKIGLVKG